MVEISLSGSGEGSGWATAPGYSTAAFSTPPVSRLLTTRDRTRDTDPVSGRFQAFPRPILPTLTPIGTGSRVAHAPPPSAPRMRLAIPTVA